jgi:hypothetical protein
LVRGEFVQRLRYHSRPPIKGDSVGEYFADILVEDEIVIELKCVERLVGEHMAQCLNYLRASGREICLLVNFQRPKVVEADRLLIYYAAVAHSYGAVGEGGGFGVVGDH